MASGLRVGNITWKMGELQGVAAGQQGAGGSREQPAVPVDSLFGFVFDSMFSDAAVEQIKECEGELRKLYLASSDRGKTQRVILRCLQKLVTDSPHAAALLTETPAILRVLCEIGLLEADVVVEWHAQGGERRGAKGAAGKVREAAEPFVAWLKEADSTVAYCA